MHSYRAYGLHFSSQIELPEFVSVNKRLESDVTIQIGEIPSNLEGQATKGILYEANANQFLFKIEHVARYLVQNGNNILIHPRPDAVLADIRVFLLGTCIGALLHQRGILALHASAINTELGAVVFTGPSGIGKSTLVNAFLKHGYNMLTDDIAAIKLDEANQPRIMPGCRRTKLWADAARQLSIDVTHLARTRPQLEKYDYYVPNQFESSPGIIHRIYCLTTNNADELSIHAIPKMRIVQNLVFNTYRHQFLDGLAMRDNHFRLLTEVASKTTVTRVSRPLAPYRLDALVDMLHNDIFSEVEHLLSS